MDACEPRTWGRHGRALRLRWAAVRASGGVVSLKITLGIHQNGRSHYGRRTIDVVRIRWLERCGLWACCVDALDGSEAYVGAGEADGAHAGDVARAGACRGRGGQQGGDGAD